jgi:hypothetical protein
MKRTGIVFLALAACVLPSSPPSMRAQAATDDKPKAEAHAEKTTPLKVEVVWAEFEGDKKVKSLPYILSVNAGPNRDFQASKLRVGTKVPAHTLKDGALQYIDVGTNIDCRAWKIEDGSYRLELVVERSWVESEVLIPGAGDFKEPVISQFRTETVISLRDGQTTQTTVSTDPVSGRVSKIEVSLSVLK